MSDERNRVAQAIANVREGGWPADTYALLQQHYLTMADAALAEIGAVRVKTSQDYDPEMLNALLDYIERVEKTEHGMDGAVREIARRAAALRGPTFRSVRVRSRSR